MSPIDIIKKLAQELNLPESQVSSAVQLMDQGNTIPFIARYRKEATGSLDDQVLRRMQERLEYLRSLEKRREEISSAIAGQEKLTPELASAIEAAATLTELEDLYRPYRPKRKTRASAARERGLEPLAAWLLSQETGDPAARAEAYVSEEKGVPSAEAALAGAQDILAEDISDDAGVRRDLREFTFRTGVLQVKASDPSAASVYETYYDFAEPVHKAAGHRILAIERGEREGFLKVSVEIESSAAVTALQRKYVKNQTPASQLVAAACADGFARLIFPSIEREIRSQLAEEASEKAIRVFSTNLRQLLLQPPVKNAVTMGFDPAYRTGCKIAVVDGTGKVLETAVVYPTAPHKDVEGAKKKLTDLIRRHGVTVIAIGNGTASRESEQFVAEMLREIPEKVSYMVVSEAGASVYSASKLGAEEFPQFDVSLRSAVSIARRLQDPLAELVKIDPKAIGVGQYQHDMPQKQLGEALDGVVEDCVNGVGVDLNTASQPLLARVAGVNSAVARNIVAYREENGRFTDRSQLKKVPKLGAKAFEQCAGFLRVTGGKNVLDSTGVHPESYAAAKGLLTACGYSLADVGGSSLDGLRNRAEEKGLRTLAEELGVGVPTLRDIIGELQKPGRDPRDELPPPLLRTDVMEMKDLKPGMELRGTVRNVIDFGAFVDIGVHQDGLVHISQICDRYIRHPLEAVKVGDVVTVWVLDVDLKKKRISLTMKRPAQA
ncbi:MAG TPA: RNA-binding transcriptional accessory protein [Candidatus Merdivicinus intestinavium]|nr:RNA-binding transcriptional accessory protein [Candidatus Merdivicinus intestinavium]